MLRRFRCAFQIILNHRQDGSVEAHRGIIIIIGEMKNK